MSHFHLDIHVNMHTIGTVIVSSLAVVTITAIEFINLNWALAYEREAVVNEFVMNNKQVSNNRSQQWQIHNKTVEDFLYSSEVILSSATELSKEAKKSKEKIKKVLKYKNSKITWSNDIKKLFLLNDIEKEKVNLALNSKIKRLESNWDISKKSFDRKLWYLYGIQEIILGY